MLTLFLAGVFLSILFGVLAWRLTRTLPTRGVTSILVHIFLLAAALLIVFAYWGQYTAPGHRAFDEMDGIIPFWPGRSEHCLPLERCWRDGWADAGADLAGRKVDRRADRASLGKPAIGA